jgi:hypothetical protein
MPQCKGGVLSRTFENNLTSEHEGKTVGQLAIHHVGSATQRRHTVIIGPTEGQHVSTCHVRDVGRLLEEVGRSEAALHRHPIDVERERRCSTDRPKVGL